ncbi:MAG: hypothetical protein AAB019_03090 [Planctomycetota bacterium]
MKQSHYSSAIMKIKFENVNKRYGNLTGDYAKTELSERPCAANQLLKNKKILALIRPKNIILISDGHLKGRVVHNEF